MLTGHFSLSCNTCAITALIIIISPQTRAPKQPPNVPFMIGNQQLIAVILNVNYFSKQKKRPTIHHPFDTGRFFFSARPLPGVHILQHPSSSAIQTDSQSAHPCASDDSIFNVVEWKMGGWGSCGVSVEGGGSRGVSMLDGWRCMAGVPSPWPLAPGSRPLQLTWHGCVAGGGWSAV